jgi:hypothetical protein
VEVARHGQADRELTERDGQAILPRGIHVSAVARKSATAFRLWRQASAITQATGATPEFEGVVSNITALKADFVAATSAAARVAADRGNRQ